MALGPERSVLLISDEWRCMSDGLHGVNRSVALDLSRYEGVSVYCALITPLEDVPEEDKRDADNNGIVLICPSENGEKFQPSKMWQKFNSDPLSVFPMITRVIPSVTHIVGHSPVTAEGAVKLRQICYQESKVLLFYHVIPDDVGWLKGTLPYEAPSGESLVSMAEEADVVFTVTDKLHWYFSAKFRNRAKKTIDHRLFLPQSPVEMFEIERDCPSQQTTPVVLVIASGPPTTWHGLDIAACAVNKVALSTMNSSSTQKIPKLVFGNVRDSDRVSLKRHVSPFLSAANLDVEYHSYDKMADLQKDLKHATMAIMPCRAEPLGHLALSILSAGVPCLLAEHFAVSTMLKRLTSEPEYLLVPVTPSTNAVRQDASVWKDRILNYLADVDVAHDRAVQLRRALRRDEATKVTHDIVIRYCLGGISLRHHVTRLTFKVEEDAELELPVLRALNQFVSETLRQCWRLKHHALTTEDDLRELLPGVSVPFHELLQNVTNKIEGWDRRIVAVDDTSGAFIVYCPTPEALSDLWAMCDVINWGLFETLLGGRAGDILGRFGLKRACISSFISGPDFLKYKRDLVRTCRSRTAAF